MYSWNSKRAREEDDSDDRKSKEPRLSNKDSDNHVKSIDNHIYFYSEVSRKSIMDLNNEIKRITNRILDHSTKTDSKPASLYIHINSYGGSIFAAMAGIDCIRECPLEVVTIIEGCAASAGTLLSVVGDKRLMKKHSHMLIHQLSSGFWGKMNEIEDEIKNLNKLMDIIKGIYMEHTKIPKKEISKLLKHDLWWGTEKCLNMGLIDSIVQPKKLNNE